MTLPGLEGIVLLMPAPLKLTKADVRRALVSYQFAPCATALDAFHKLRSVQFDPIAPAGCNHDLVLQARVQGYEVGDWEKLAYVDRKIYDGWDKQASLIPFEGWPWRRIFYKWRRSHYDDMMREHPEAVEAILSEIEARGPLMPKECEYQQHKAEWKGSWYGPNVTKQVLRGLWSAGLVMTAGRRKGQHLYDLTERVVPPEFYNQPELSDEEATLELVRERHRAMGLIRPGAAYEVWSYAQALYAGPRKVALKKLVDMDDLVSVDVEGVAAHATPDFVDQLDEQAPEPRVVFVAPLDQILWDRKMIAHVFDFDYSWEIYTPEAKRRWGYYVLPVLYGDRFVARLEFYCRGEVLEIRRWHTETDDLTFFGDLERALRQFMAYCGATTTKVDDSIDAKVRDLAGAIRL